MSYTVLNPGDREVKVTLTCVLRISEDHDGEEDAELETAAETFVEYGGPFDAAYKSNRVSCITVEKAEVIG